MPPTDSVPRPPTAPASSNPERRELEQRYQFSGQSRNRSDSTGSTRGAFGDVAKLEAAVATVPSILNQDDADLRKKKKKTNKTTSAQTKMGEYSKPPVSATRTEQYVKEQRNEVFSDPPSPEKASTRSFQRNAWESENSHYFQANNDSPLKDNYTNNRTDPTGYSYYESSSLRGVEVMPSVSDMNGNSWYGNSGAPPPPPPPPARGPQMQYTPSPTTKAPMRDQEISMFSEMAQSGYGTVSSPPPVKYHHVDTPMEYSEVDVKVYDERQESNVSIFTYFFGPNTSSFDEPVELGALPTFLRHVLYNPEVPEFTSLQQFSWAVLIGIFMGAFTAYWGFIIEGCVDFMWKDVPETLLEWGFFTEEGGSFPLFHYMWICPAIFGGILSYITEMLPNKIPGQNEWISSLHRRGVQDHGTFVNLLLVSTAGMASGLSLGPELPLVLSAGMVGSYLAVVTKQSILSARVMNLTAASAAIGGFFGFPMAGALFVLELPHRMGLQYFEALSPATIASIVAVLVNRIITGNDVKGYFNYPFLTTTLPSGIFYIAVMYGLVGSLVGVFYAEVVKKIKTDVHHWFVPHDNHHGSSSKVHHGTAGTVETWESNGPESVPLVGSKMKMRTQPQENGLVKFWKKVTSFGIKNDAIRAGVSGSIAGMLTGVICIFVPHALFWGEAQLQTLIDQGKTPLPVFGEEGEPTSALTSYGFCLINPDDEIAVEEGLSLGCAALLTVTKVLTIGLSLGTGIVGGHFWGPLYVGCAASHFFTKLMSTLDENFGVGESLYSYPCVAILCIMASAHVVSFRAHLAIMLILTLTISTFSSNIIDGAFVGGDYSAVFPLLVVSSFIALMLTRSTVFYKEQRCRGDIVAMPEVLCEPGKDGQPLAHTYDDGEYEDYDSDEGDLSWDGLDDNEREGDVNTRHVQVPVTAGDIEQEFERQNRPSAQSPRRRPSKSPLPPRFQDKTTKVVAMPNDSFMEHEGADAATDSVKKNPHRRTRSGSELYKSQQYAKARSGSLDAHEGEAVDGKGRRVSTTGADAAAGRERLNSSSSSRPGTPTLLRVSSFGEVADFQPDLMTQARSRASSASRPPSLPKGSNSGRHSRKNSDTIPAIQGVVDGFGGIPMDEVERTFGSMMNQHTLNRN